MSNSLQPHGLGPPRLLRLWDFPGKSTGVGCRFLLQRIFPTQELNPGLLHCRQILYQLSYEGNAYYVPSNNGEIKSPGGSEDKASACNAGDLGSVPESGSSPGEGNGNPLQYSCLENPMNRGTWLATVHGIARVGHDLETKPPSHVDT